MEEEKNRIKKDFSLALADLKCRDRLSVHPVFLELYSANKELEYGIELYYHVEWKIVDIDESHIYVTNLKTGSRYHVSVIYPSALYVDVYRILENGEEISPWNDTDLDIVAYYTPAEGPDRLVTRDKRFLYVPVRDVFKIFPPYKEWQFRPNPSWHVAECWTYQPLGMGTACLSMIQLLKPSIKLRRRNSQKGERRVNMFSLSASGKKSFSKFWRKEKKKSGLSDRFLLLFRLYSVILQTEARLMRT